MGAGHPRWRVCQRPGSSRARRGGSRGGVVYKYLACFKSAPRSGFFFLFFFFFFGIQVLYGEHVTKRNLRFECAESPPTVAPRACKRHSNHSDGRRGHATWGVQVQVGATLAPTDDVVCCRTCEVSWRLVHQPALTSPRVTVGVRVNFSLAGLLVSVVHPKLGPAKE